MKINIKTIAASIMTIVFAFGVQGSLAAVTGSTQVNGGSCDGAACGVTCGVDCSGFVNELTGPNSINENKATINRDVDFTVDNCADADDEFNVLVNTDLGDISGNTVIGNVETGSADVDIRVIQDLNRDPLVIPEMGSIAIPGAMANSVTGPFSENINRVVVNDNTNIDIRNTAKYSGIYNLDAQTGGSSISGNTSVGNITTGDVSMSVNENVTLNRNANSVRFPDVQSIEIPSLTNSVTGPNSTNTNTFRVNNDYNVSVNNKANIDNDFNVSANTGGNVIDGNTCVGNIRTGDVRFNLNVQSSAN